MLNKIRIVICSGMLVVAVSMSYLSYTLIGDIGKLEERNQELVTKLEERRQDIKRLETSCKIDNEVSFETLEKAQELTEKMPAIMEKLEKIEIKQNEVPANDQTKAEKASATRAIDRADDELMELLDEAYCTATGNSPYCAARQPAD